MDGKNLAQGTKENHKLSTGIIGLHITCTADYLCELLEMCEFLLITPTPLFFALLVHFTQM